MHLQAVGKMSRISAHALSLASMSSTTTHSLSCSRPGCWEGGLEAFQSLDSSLLGSPTRLQKMHPKKGTAPHLWIESGMDTHGLSLLQNDSCANGNEKAIIVDKRVSMHLQLQNTSCVGWVIARSGRDQARSIIVLSINNVMATSRSMSRSFPV